MNDIKENKMTKFTNILICITLIFIIFVSGTTAYRNVVGYDFPNELTDDLLEANIKFAYECQARNLTESQCITLINNL